ncbi:MAG: NAD(P)/FAD-dependent oxidoreductase [Polyangiaceae bacterium]|nr:NAD(P)/FAD-dependent oxidoreductase [Polyangiaceae bacterium]
MPDAVVIGSGPNGLSAAAILQRAGWSVEVYEANARPGGACRSAPLTLPGFVHDEGAAFFPFGPVSPAFRELDLEGAGLVFRHALYDSAHPAPDGSSAAISRDLQRSVDAFGPDGEAWRSIALWFRENQETVLRVMVGGLPPRPADVAALGFDGLMTLASVALASGRGFAEARFGTEAARRVIPGLALHTDVGPDDPCGAMVGFMLAVMASSAGFPVAEGGAGAVTGALQRRLEAAGGTVTTGRRVERVVVSEGRAVAVRLAGGDEVRATRAVLADVGAPALYGQLLEGTTLPGTLTRRMSRFRWGFGTFKVDWALAGPVPWLAEQARQSAVVHAGDGLNDLARFTAEVRAGRLPNNPYMVIGQPTLADPTRAPAGRHTLYAYSRVPSRAPRGWAAEREGFADRLEARVERLAPGFRALVLGRSIQSPDDLERENENLVGGDLGGGTAAFTNQLFFRPAFPHFGAKTPVRGLYLASSYTHPGPGVHGMCGLHAARAAIADAG